MNTGRRTLWLGASLSFITGVVLLVMPPRKSDYVNSASPTRHIRLGLPFPSMKVAVGNGTTDIRQVISGKWTFVLRRGVLNEGVLEYPSTLLARHGDNLRVVVLLSVRTTSLPENAQYVDGLSIAAVDNANTDRAILEPDWTCLVDPAGRVRFFIEGGITPEPLRELTERFLFGRIQYNPSESSGRPAAGQVLPQFDAVSVYDGSKMSAAELTPPGHSLLFFQANCTSCGLRGIMETLDRANQFLGSLETRRVHIIFSRTFTRSALRAAADGLEVGKNIRIADRYIDDWEDSYYVGPGASKDALLIPVSAGFRLGVPVSYSSWILQQQGDPVAKRRIVQ